jgi:hypothetical protein
MFDLLRLDPIHHRFWHDGLDLTFATTAESVTWMNANADQSQSLTTTSYFTTHPLNPAGPFATQDTIFYKCPDGADCLTDPDTGAVACGEGQEGVLCATCTQTYFQDVSGKCQKCTDHSADAEGVALFIAVYVGLPLLCTTVVYSAYKSSENLRILTKRVVSSAFSKVKIIAGFYTVVVLFEDVYTLPYPEVYRKFMGYFKIFDFFPALRMLKVACTIEYSFHTMLYTSSFVMAFLMALVIVNQFWYTRFGTNALPSKAIAGILFAITMMYPSSSTLAFRAFNCRAIDGVYYHREDYSIDCGSSAHTDAEGFAVASILFVSCGLLVLYAVLLWPHREGLRTGMQSTKTNGLRSISFLYCDFVGEYYYWEIVDAGRKLVVCGFVVFLEPDSLLRPVVGMLMCFAYIVLLVQVKPYKRAVHNYMAIIANIMLFFCLCGGLLSKIESGFVSTGEDTLGFNEQGLGWMLIICFVSILVMGVGCLVRDLRKIRQQTVLTDSGGQAVVLKKLPAGHYHLFLSHTWGSGQNQMQALKKELQLLIPSMEVFLDVENLTNIGALEELIECSDSGLIFLSTGYFERWNCLREARETIVQGKDLILLRESAKMHGGGEMELVMSEVEENKTLFKEFAAAYDTADSKPVDIKKSLFDDRTSPVLLWHHVLELKRATLKMIGARMLQQQGQEYTQLSIPGELRAADIRLPALQPEQKYHVCLPQACRASEGFIIELMLTLEKLTSHGASFHGRDQSISSTIKMGICSKDGCTLQASSNMLFVLNIRAFSNKQLMQELREALVLGVNVVTMHVKDEGEDFDNFIGACPSDLKSGKILHKGQQLSCPGLFEGIAVDWFTEATEYQCTCAMLLLQKLRQTEGSGSGSRKEDDEEVVHTEHLEIALMDDTDKTEAPVYQEGAVQSAFSDAGASAMVVKVANV